jgi:transcriptional regulator with XRE-family HTH domain
MDKAIFGAILKKRISEKGYSQEQFADIAGIGHSTLKKYLKGEHSYTYEILMIFSEKLDCSYDYLLGYSKVPERENKDIRNVLRLSAEATNILKAKASIYDSDDMSKCFINTINAMIISENFMDSVMQYMLTTPEMSVLFKNEMKTLSEVMTTNLEQQGREVNEEYFPLPELELIERLSIYECLRTVKEHY